MVNSYIQPGDNPDLTAERRQATFDTEELTVLFQGSARSVKRRREIYDYYQRSPDLQDPVPVDFLDRVEKYENAQRKMALLTKHVPKVVPDGNFEDLMNFFSTVFQQDGFPLGLHNSMLIPTIENNADDEQKREWLPKARANAFIGTYAQTELGHGTNLRKLETTATYDPNTEEFVLHSPTVTASKWWPGNLGKSSNFTVVVARLISKGKDYGPHPFFVQIRDPVTHKSVPGVTVGDIGPKFGINTNDNGFLRFDHLRIPRRNMFMKNAKVQPDGTYIPPVHDKLAYGSMVYVRSFMIRGMAHHLAQAATVAIRYSAIRRQGEVTPGAGEVQVLDYQTQQYRLLPQVARAWAFEIAGRYTRYLYQEFLSGIDKGSAAILPELHAVTSGLKSLVTHHVCLGIEQSRMACGGHGYSAASGLPQLYGIVVGGCTYEGENMVMLLQCARFLVKIAAAIRKGVAPGFKSEATAYFFVNSASNGNVSTPSGALAALEHASRRLTLLAYDRLEAIKATGKSHNIAWTEAGVDLRRAATAHTRTFIVRQFIEFVKTVKATPATKAVLEDLLKLYVYYEVIEADGDLLFDGHLKGADIEAARVQIYEALRRLRPNAVSLVDAFDFNERELNSVIGRRDGHVYENLLKWAQNSPLNKNDVLPFHHKYLGKAMIDAQDGLFSKL
uniref:Acyl-coenzyme A oxidase n=1 Tax=Panagrellus redivivus TaxID=6233 RepID=A0A7E4VAT1_PANRE